MRTVRQGTGVQGFWSVAENRITVLRSPAMRFRVMHAIDLPTGDYCIRLRCMYAQTTNPKRSPGHVRDTPWRQLRGRTILAVACRSGEVTRVHTVIAGYVDDPPWQLTVIDIIRTLLEQVGRSQLATQATRDSLIDIRLHTRRGGLDQSTGPVR